MKTIQLINQGCRLNQSETSALSQLLESEGFQIQYSNDADIALINTCTVTENGDADTRRLINKLVRDNQDVQIALIGCQSQVHKEQLLSLKNVKWVIGTSQKMQSHKIIKSTLEESKQILEVEKVQPKPFTIDTTSIDTKHTRANIKVQDGCDFYCSFCVIPFARGPARSRVFEDIIREAIELADAGFKELVVTGVNIATYEYEDKRFLDVIKGLCAIETVERIRISSIEPTTIPKELILMMRDNPKLCRYLHIPLQSGSNDILQAMSRKYDMAEFRAFVEWAYKTVPDICIGTDVIVGFPGEEKRHMDETTASILTLPFHYLHVFSYSQRKLARSKKLDPIDPQTIAERSKTLRNVSKKLKKAYYIKQLSKTLPCLFEQEKNGYWLGTTDNYIRVKVKSNGQNLKNQLLPVYLERYEKESIIGSL